MVAMHPPGGHRERPTPLIGAVIIAMLAAIVYAPTFTSAFHWDDADWLWENPVIVAGDGPWRFFVTDQTQDYFPLTSAQLSAQWSLFGKHAPGYYVVGVVQHAAAGILLWRVLMMIGMSTASALTAAILFVVHPVSVATVAWIAEQKNTLSALLYLATTWCYLRGEEAESANRWRVASWILFVLGLLAKPAGVLLPLVLPVLRWMRHGRPDRAAVLRLTPYVVAAAAISVVAIWFQGRYLGQVGTVPDENLLTRMAIAQRAWWFYAAKALAPVNLMVVYPRWQLDGANPAAHLPGAALAACAAVLVWRLVTARGALVALAAATALLLPVLGLFRMTFHQYSFVADHWAYAALPALMAFFVAAGAKLLRGPWRIAAAIVVILTFATLAHARARVYRSNVSLWSDNIRRHPQCWVAHYIVGVTMNAQGQDDQALRYLTQAVRLHPRSAEAQGSLGLVLLQRGDDAAAADHLNLALSLGPRKPQTYVDAHNNLAACYLRQGDPSRAEDHCRRGLQLDGSNVPLLLNLGLALRTEQRFDEAIAVYHRAIDIAPDDDRPRTGLAAALEGARAPDK